MKYGLRSLLIVVLVGPPAIASSCYCGHHFSLFVQLTRWHAGGSNGLIGGRYGPRDYAFAGRVQGHFVWQSQGGPTR
jgi:hypothetical protein